MKNLIVAALALTIAGSALGPANAQQPSGQGGGGAPGEGQGGGGGRGGAIRGACRDDIQQLCADIQPGRGQIMQCLREHQDRVSDGCKTAMSEARAARRERQGSTSDAPPPPSPNR